LLLITHFRLHQPSQVIELVELLFPGEVIQDVEATQGFS
jgi:hypothetical protein